MLFNSIEFIFVFLPVVLLVFYMIGSYGNHRVAISWLVGASLFFYGWWNPAYLGLILGSILFNYAMGAALLAGKTGRMHLICWHLVWHATWPSLAIINMQISL